jgi:uncharacterized surface protein with fasciclin (FAS1) repeats
VIRWFKSMCVAGSVALLAACGGGGGPELPVVDRASVDPRFTTLEAAVDAAGLRSALSGTGPFTLFAPTNAAFDALLAELGITRAQLLANRELLTAVLSYHVVPGRVERAQVPVGPAITTLQGGVFKVTAAGGALTITDGRNRSSTITQTDISASNGVIHVVDRVLLPADRNIVQTAQALPDFSILVDAVVSAGLVEALSAAGPFTVFAPTNTAFAALLAELGVSAEDLLADTELLTRVLTYHVVPGRVLAADIVAGAPVATLQGGNFRIGAGNVITDARARTANIVATDVFTSNGVIHVIDRVILPLPAENIVQVAQGNPAFSILVQAVVAAELVETLSGPGPFTVFAPTDAAFAALLAELNVTAEALLADTELLTAVLTYHVVPGRVLAAQIVPDTPITTVQGGTFSIGAGNVITDGRARTAGIVATDVFASNGVVHVIDRVILPAAGE